MTVAVREPPHRARAPARRGDFSPRPAPFSGAREEEKRSRACAWLGEGCGVRCRYALGGRARGAELGDERKRLGELVLFLSASYFTGPGNYAMVSELSGLVNGDIPQNLNRALFEDV
ncbi:coiled-coil domain-containing protein 126 isoform X2 [Dermochelys coriacea]|uniref:coiled-coil domain-containing protein 126 isoform X2 n=1 Tax=Dermochelys coriacea TaxID=27794 RepID=UPI001CA97682|nr:coiled-coil domain-containing protein 126 isoform X2 [Dermochelys coriacea]